ncbi:MAG: NUDIX hydrolase [Candidatus Eremiobacteraeota bacterium]|nr:NUDIX hydrolase [Candidatus Eremiobacteraeota bacterium]
MSETGYVRRAKRVVYENPWLRFEAHEIVHPTGVAGEHGVVVTPRASAVVLVDGDEVLLTRQARFAIDRVVLEVVKGGRHAGEDGLACAQRESREEAGVIAARWMPLGVTYEIPSIVEEAVELFLGAGLSPAPLPPEAVERIDVVRMRFSDALDACADGRIADAVTAIALLRAHKALERRP